MSFKFSSEKFPLSTLCKYFFILGLLIYLIFISIPKQFSDYSPVPGFFSSFKKTPQTITSFSSTTNDSQTNLNHLVFGLLGSEKAWHYRISYIQSWWRPKQCRGFIYLDKPPTQELLPWSELSPSYKVSEDLTKFLEETNARAPIMIRMVHSIMEVFRQVEHEDFRWLVMGDDDSIFFIENMVDVLREYDHTKYYYFGGQSEFILSNYWYSFNQGFGGAGFILSYPLAKALAQDMENCLRRHAQLSSADLITMVCIADLGVNLSPHKGIHQIDLRGDISGFLSSHPKSPLLSLHHFDSVDPIFPAMDSFNSTRHLMKAAKSDQSRLMQQTICHHRQNNWTFSVSWGYSAHLYHKILPRSFLQNPIETFRTWSGGSRDPNYMFNTRLPSDDPGENPRVFFFRDVNRTSEGILTTYSRALPQNHSTTDDISEIQVLSPTVKRIQMDRCECCDIVSIDGERANLKFRECLMNEVIA